MKNSQIKILTKGIINGTVKKSFLLLLFGCFALAAFTAIPVLINQFVSDEIISIAAVFLSVIIFAFFCCAFGAGSNAWFCFYKRENRAGRVIYWFWPKNNFKAFRLYSSLFFIKLLWTILMLLPGTIVIFSFCYLAYDTGLEFNLFACGIIGGVVLSLLGLIFRFIILQRYFMAQYFFVSDPKIKINQAIRKSCEVMNGKLKKTALFKLSFIPWILLCVGIFPLLYVWPYYRQSCILFANEIKQTV